MKDYIGVICSGNYSRFFYLDNSDDKKQILDYLSRADNSSWITRIYLKINEELFNLYLLSSGLNYDNINMLYNYYDKDMLTPVLMEMKLSK